MFMIKKCINDLKEKFNMNHFRVNTSGLNKAVNLTVELIYFLC